MNALNLAQRAYNTAQTPIRTTRGTEYAVFAQVTHHLKAAAEKGRPAFAQLAQAIHENRQLWALLAADVSDSDNGLPQQLRAQIFYLAEFTNQHSSKVLNGKDKADVLIEINTSIMRGLRAAGGAT